METEEELIRIVKNDPFYIKSIENPSEKVQLEALKNYVFAIKCIKNPTEEIQLKSVQQHGSSIFYIENPTEEVIRTAILNGAKKEDLEHIDISKLSDETKLMIELM